MVGTKISKLPSHVYTNFFDVSKSSLIKLNSDIKANTLKISGSKVEILPKDLRVKTLVVDSKTAKHLSLTTIKNCETIEIDGSIYTSSISIIGNDIRRGGKVSTGGRRQRQ